MKIKENIPLIILVVLVVLVLLFSSSLFVFVVDVLLLSPILAVLLFIWLRGIKKRQKKSG
jgi:multidrug efflux pump subunit AcrB